ncbi:MAG: hypothetical protein ACXAC2_25435, partial [Candidatus Kariarchaeaceae archaeon]
MYIAVIIFGSLLIPALVPNFDEKQFTKIFTGQRSVDIYGTPEIQKALLEFRDRAKEIWDNQPNNEKNLTDVALGIYSEDQRGNISRALHHVIRDAKYDDPDFLHKQVIVALQPEINNYVVDKMQKQNGPIEIADGLEVDRQKVNNWIKKYHLNDPASLNDPRYFFYKNDLYYERGHEISRSKGRDDRWKFPKSTGSAQNMKNIQPARRSSNRVQR